MAIDVNNSSTPTPFRPRERRMTSPLLRLPELESKDIMGGGGGVSLSGVVLEGEELRGTGDSADAEEVPVVARVPPSPFPRALPPQWALKSVDHHSRRAECHDLPKFVMLDPLCKPGMKRSVPTRGCGGGGGGGGLGGVREESAEPPSRRAFKRFRPAGPAGPAGCNDASFARVGFRLRMRGDFNAVGGECT